MVILLQDGAGVKRRDRMPLTDAIMLHDSCQASLHGVEGKPESRNEITFSRIQPGPSMHFSDSHFPRVLSCTQAGGGLACPS